MLNPELECLLVTRRIDDFRSEAERSRLLRAARTPRAQRRRGQAVPVPHAKDLRKERA